MYHVSRNVACFQLSIKSGLCIDKLVFFFICRRSGHNYQKFTHNRQSQKSNPESEFELVITTRNSHTQLSHSEFESESEFKPNLDVDVQSNNISFF